MNTPPKLVKLSDQSKKLKQLLQARGGVILPESFEKTVVIQWLKTTDPVHKNQTALLERFRASLLQDLAGSLGVQSKLKTPALKPGWAMHLLWGSLIFSGIFMAISDGFLGMLSILQLFAAIPSIILLSASIAASVLLAVMFCSYELFNISKQLNVKYFEATQLIDVYRDQVTQLKSIRKHLRDQDLLKDEGDLLEMLLIRYQALHRAREEYRQATQNPWLKGMQLAVNCVVGFLWLGGGFFSGQSLALAIAGFFVSSISPMAWPILIPSVVMSLCVLAMYWALQRPEIDESVGRWFGLDQDKIMEFVDPEAEAHQESKFQALKEKSPPKKTGVSTPELSFFRPKPERRKSKSLSEIEGLFCERESDSTLRP